MSAFISRKQSLLILLGGLCAAAGTALSLCCLLAGPRLGSVYDALQDHRPPPPVSREILLIDTGETAEGGDVFSVLMALSELGGDSLVIEVPVSGPSTGTIADSGEIRRRFNDEYALLGRNIQSLFEAIRVGSVPPSESPRYVENLVELAERGRDRLITALIRQDEADAARVAGAAAAFGRTFMAGDIRSPSSATGDPAGAAAGDFAAYSRPRPDHDGRLRRIAPLTAADGTPGGEVSAIEHIVFQALKPRWAEYTIEYAEQGPVLTIRQTGGARRRFALDREGNIIIEKPRHDNGFRRLELARFHEYEEADRAMRQLLSDVEALGVYSETVPERIPPMLYDYALALREELLKTPGPEKRADWIAARSGYFAGLEEFLYGPSEMALVGGYEEIIATEKLKEEGLVKLRSLRDELIRAFVDMREQYRRLTESRELLAEAVASSICVMGPAAGETGPAESSAALANALLTGAHITPGGIRYALFCSLLAAFVMLAAIHTLRPSLVLTGGLAAALLCAALFGCSFIISAYWIDPLISAASCLSGTLVIFTARSLLIRGGSRRFRAAYGPVVSKPCLAKLVRAGRPRLSEIIVVPAAMITVKNPELRDCETREDPVTAARTTAEFHGAVSKIFKKTGAAVLSCEGDTILACFGSPPELLCLEQSRNGTPRGGEYRPALAAGNWIAELFRNGEPPWYIGIDCGECAFSWSEEAGYTASGRPMVRSRLLASIAARRRIRVLVTDTVRRQLPGPARKIGAMTPAASGESEAIHELLPLVSSP
jgi:hypothetical protein